MAIDYTGIAQLITSIATLVGAVAGFIIVVRQLKGVHVALNSRLTELVDKTEKASHAEGVIAGREQEISRAKEAGDVVSETAKAAALVMSEAAKEANKPS